MSDTKSEKKMRIKSHSGFGPYVTVSYLDLRQAVRSALDNFISTQYEQANYTHTDSQNNRYYTTCQASAEKFTMSIVLELSTYQRHFLFSTIYLKGTYEFPGKGNAKHVRDIMKKFLLAWELSA